MTLIKIPFVVTKWEILSTISHEALLLRNLKRVVQHSKTVPFQHEVRKDKKFKCFEKESKVNQIYPLPHLIDFIHQFLFD